MIPPPPISQKCIASLRSETFGKGPDRLGDELNADGHFGRRRLPREHVVPGPGAEARTQLQAPLEGLRPRILASIERSNSGRP